jgi:chemotaxis protein CheX
MTTETKVRVSPGDLAQIVVSVFTTMLGLEADAAVTPWFPSHDRLAGSVQLTGDWNGAILLECDRAQACRFAGRFLTMDPPPAVDDLVRDALGELANMIGGNLKSVLAQGSRSIRLSIPKVLDGGDSSPLVCRAKVCERVAFCCDEGPFWITVLATRA